LSKKAIMFVDDSATMRTIAEKTFHSEPFDVVTVPSGEAAVAKLRDIRPSLALVDIGMAGVNGYDVCKAIREDAELGRIPVIVMSGVSTPYDENRGREVGATEHIKKPFDTAKLIERVEELIKSAPSVAVDGEAIPLQPKVATQVKPAPTMMGLQPIPPVAPKVQGPPVVPLMPKAPARPVPPPVAVAARPMTETPIKETMEFSRANPVMRHAEAEIPQKGDAEFQVGTLAELAQKGAVEKKAKPEQPLAAAAVRDGAGAAAARIAGEIGGGLTADQVAAIQRLTAEVVERVVWEVVPDLAEVVIRERLEELLKK
jgi:CheY-like chemotaxis protein